MKAECYNCRFLEKNLEDSRVGRCRRFPPTYRPPHQYEDDFNWVDSWEFPIVTLELEDWCGEFQLHPDANEDDPDWRDKHTEKPPYVTRE